MKSGIINRFECQKLEMKAILQMGLILIDSRAGQS